MVAPRRLRALVRDVDRTGVAILEEMKENTLPVAEVADPTAVDQSDGRLQEARRALGRLEKATGADSLAPARHLAELLEDLLEGREGERS